MDVEIIAKRTPNNQRVVGRVRSNIFASKESGIKREVDTGHLWTRSRYLRIGANWLCCDRLFADAKGTVNHALNIYILF